MQKGLFVRSNLILVFFQRDLWSVLKNAWDLVVLVFPT